jgi:uncharacterized protein
MDMDARTAGEERKALDEAVGRLVEAFHPDLIYLFGSQARGDATEDSDYDIMVIVPNSDQPRYARAQEGYGVLWGIPIAKDLLIWTRDEFERQTGVEASLPASVLREGRLLYAA